MIDLKKAQALLDKGTSYQDIAKKLGCSTSALAYHVGAGNLSGSRQAKKFNTAKKEVETLMDTSEVDTEEDFNSDIHISGNATQLRRFFRGE